MEKNLTDEVEGESEFIELKKCDVDFFFFLFTLLETILISRWFEEEDFGSLRERERENYRV